MTRTLHQPSQWIASTDTFSQSPCSINFWKSSKLIPLGMFVFFPVMGRQLTTSSRKIPKKRSFINPSLFLNAMIFEENKSIEKLGQTAGYLFSYFVFTTLLFFIFTRLNRLPSGWSFFHVMALTLVVALVGSLLKRLLK
jgi:hypothetical protein